MTGLVARLKDLLLAEIESLFGAPEILADGSLQDPNPWGSWGERSGPAVLGDQLEICEPEDKPSPRNLGAGVHEVDRWRIDGG